MSLNKLIHKVLYRTLPLGGYLRAVSGMFFLFYRLGIGRRSPATEYVYHLPRLVKAGDTAIDIGANLGYYSRPLSDIVGTEGHVWSVEPVRPISDVLRRNLGRRRNVEILGYALGTENRNVVMGNDSVRESGYMGTGQNFVDQATDGSHIRFTAEMRRGSELFGDLERIDFVKCDIEGYEVVVMTEMRPLLEKFRPTVLIETGGDNRRKIAALFASLDYKGYTLWGGEEIPLTSESSKDIIFRYEN